MRVSSNDGFTRELYRSSLALM